jgi:hypothetical protein
MEAEPPKADPPKRKRRWFQFSLRTLMIGVVLWAIGCWLVFDRVRLLRERDEAMQKQEQLEREVRDLKGWLAWRMSGSKTADAGLANLKALIQLESLQLKNTQIIDAAIPQR